MCRRHSSEGDADSPMPPKKDVTLVHVTTLDEVVSVSLYFSIIFSIIFPPSFIEIKI